MSTSKQLGGESKIKSTNIPSNDWAEKYPSDKTTKNYRKIKEAEVRLH